ncbi:MAG: hypothetical protein ACXWT1_06615 [Methylobacter sp.]
MNELFKDIPSGVQYEITSLIYSGDKIGAIKRYRETANCDLKTAKDVIDAVTVQLKTANPLAFNESQHKDGSGCAVVIVLLIIGAVAVVKIPEAYKNDWEKLNTLLQTASDKLSNSEITIKAPELSQRITDDLPSQPIVAPKPGERIERNTLYQAIASKPAELIDRDPPYQPIAPANLETDLTTLYRQKLANTDYVAWLNKPGIPLGYQEFIEEHHIKYVRAKIAKDLFLPANTKPLKIPVIAAAKITINGDIQQQEWQQAIRIPLQPEETGSILYLQADNDWLYLAADVPGDTTEKGFDQFRFYIHVDIDPAIRNERIHVDRSKFETLGGIRQTRVMWQGEPPKNDDERWKKYPISDWRIYRMAKGASTLQQHRQFEAKLNLKESGLTIGSPLPVFVEIETDPLYVDGKFKKRVYLGGLGNQNQPVWMMMK